MQNMNEIRLPRDEQGFLPSHFNEKMNSIHSELEAIYRLLVQQFGLRHNSVVHTQYEEDLNRASREIRNFQDAISDVKNEISQKYGDKNKEILNYSQSRIRSIRNNTNETNDFHPIRSITPIQNQVVPPFLPQLNQNRVNTQNQSPINTQNQNQSSTNRRVNERPTTNTITTDSQGRQRDSRGRFIGGKTKSGDNKKSEEPSKGFWKDFKDTVALNFKNGMSADTQGVDPTLDALKELKGTLTPLKSLSDLALKPLSGIAKLRKRNEPIPREQDRVNTQELNLLRSIDRHSGNQLTPISLARMLPMAGLAIAGAVVMLLIPKLKELLGLNDTPTPAPDDYNKPSAGEISRPSDNALGTGVSLRNTHEGEGLQQIIGKDKPQSANNFFNVSGKDTSTHEKTKAYIRKYEHYSKMPYWDKTAWRGGYASDTYTDKDGKVHTVKQGQAVSKEDAERDLERRTKIFTQASRNKVGGDNWDKLSDEAKAVSTSIAYNYGSLPKSVVNAIQSGDENKLAKEVKARGADNNGIRQPRYTEMSNFISNRGKNSASSYGDYGSASVKGGNAVSSQLPKDIKMPQALVIKPLSEVNVAQPKTAPQSVKPLSAIKANTDAQKAQSVQPQQPELTPITQNQSINLNNAPQQTSNISQNVGDRSLHHAISGGIAVPKN